MELDLKRRAALSWARGRELPPQRLWRVLREAGSLEALLALPEAELGGLLGSPARALALLRSPEDRQAERWAAEVERTGLLLITAFDEEYPHALSEIADPPFALFARGRLERTKLPAVAVVGSRAASRYGREVAARIARELSQAGVTVVSGFARGVDAAAHEAAREGPGGTIAVLGCGLDVNYPREHTRLKEAMAATDLLLSEHAPVRRRRAEGEAVGARRAALRLPSDGERPLEVADNDVAPELVPDRRRKEPGTAVRGGDYRDVAHPRDRDEAPGRPGTVLHEQSRNERTDDRRKCDQKDHSSDTSRVNRC